MDRQTLTETIAGYSVTLELFKEGNDDRSECYIEKGNASASLEAARTGSLTDNKGNDVAITARDFASIEAWAEANGY